MGYSSISYTRVVYRKTVRVIRAANPTPHGGVLLVAGGRSRHSMPAVPVSNATYAFLVMEVPADATVFVGGQRTSVAGNSRVFRIPTKAASKGYTCPITIEVTRDGETRKIQHTEQLVSGRTHTVRVNENADQQLVAVAAR